MSFKNFVEYKTTQELRMLPSASLNCQVTKIVAISGSQLLELKTMSQMLQVSKNVFA